MSDCAIVRCKNNKERICATGSYCYRDKAHKPAVNGSPSSPRTSGSPAAPDSLVEGTQFNSPPFSGSGAASIKQPDGEYYYACKKCLGICYTLEHLAEHECQGK